MIEDDIQTLIDIRQVLHTVPELSGAESATAERVALLLGRFEPVKLLTGLGGHGVIAEYGGLQPGPTVLFRCELDGLPIAEQSDLSYRSANPGKAHLCGHDGHIAILLGLAMFLQQNPPECGRVVLLFQPAEETGAGANAILADSRFDPFVPDYAFALHNLPGEDLGQVSTRAGVLNCGSMGLQFEFTGVSAHASSPEKGHSPARAVGAMIDYLASFAPGGPVDDTYALSTVVFASLGERAHGVAPGKGEVWATVRATSDVRMEECRNDAIGFASRTAAYNQLELIHAITDVFHACVNDEQAVAYIADGAERAGASFSRLATPMRFSEDFGRYATKCKSAMFFLGAGRDHAPLHHPSYDFPDELIEPGIRMFTSILDAVLADQKVAMPG